MLWNQLWLQPCRCESNLGQLPSNILWAPMCWWGAKECNKTRHYFVYQNQGGFFRRFSSWWVYFQMIYFQLLFTIVFKLHKKLKMNTIISFKSLKLNLSHIVICFKWMPRLCKKIWWKFMVSKKVILQETWWKFVVSKKDPYCKGHDESPWWVKMGIPRDAVKIFGEQEVPYNTHNESLTVVKCEQEGFYKRQDESPKWTRRFPQ